MQPFLWDKGGSASKGREELFVKGKIKFYEEGTNSFMKFGTAGFKGEETKDLLRS